MLPDMQKMPTANRNLRVRTFKKKFLVILNNVVFFINSTSLTITDKGKDEQIF